MAIYTSTLYNFVGDSRDYIYQPTTEVLPTSIDWRNAITAIENQGQLGSCTANSMSGACELILRSNGSFINLSRLFNYYESRKHGGLLGQDNGAYLRDAIAVVAKVGFPVETIWPYNISDFDVVPPDDVYEDAANRKLLRYERINDGIDWTYNPALGSDQSGNGSSTIGSDQFNNDIRSALYEGHPVIIGMDLTEGFARFVGDFEYQNAHPYQGVSSTNPKTGAHALVII